MDRRTNNTEPEMTKEEIERQDALMAARLLKSNLRGPVTRGGNKKSASKPKTPTKRGKPNNAFNHEWPISHELAQVIGVSRLSRPQIVKLLWAYIKDNKLQNPNDGRQVVCDEKLRLVFKKKTVGIFQMNKLLSTHILTELSEPREVESEEEGEEPPTDNHKTPSQVKEEPESEEE